MFRPSDGVLQTATACFPTSKLRILENWIAVTFTSFRQRQLALSGVGAFVELHAYVDPSTQVMLEKSSVFDGIGLYFTSINRWLSLNYHLGLYTSRTLGSGLSRFPLQVSADPVACDCGSVGAVGHADRLHGASGQLQWARCALAMVTLVLWSKAAQRSPLTCRTATRC